MGDLETKTTNENWVYTGLQRIQKNQVSRGTHSRYGFGGQDAEGPGSVLGWVKFPPAEVELIREGRGQDHPNNVKVVGLLRYSIAVPKTFWYLHKRKQILTTSK